MMDLRGQLIQHTDGYGVITHVESSSTEIIFDRVGEKVER